MSITNATRLSDFAAGIGTEGAILQIDNANQRIGIGTQLPSQMLEVAGIVSATQYIGDGSQLEGITSAGLGTAISDVDGSAGAVVYYTDDLLTVAETTTINPPASASAAYTQYRDVKLNDSVDLIIETGDDFIPDVLSLAEGSSNPNAVGNGVFDEVYTSIIKNKDGLGAPTFANGFTSVGVGTFSSDVIISGNVSVGGTLTYEDVKNVDSVGLITARTGIKVSGGGIDINAGGLDITGPTKAYGAGSASLEWGDISYTGHLSYDSNNAIIRSATSKGLVFQTNHVNERLRINTSGAIGIGGANYGTSGQVMTSQGNSAAPQWADAGGGAWELVSSTSLVADYGASTFNMTGFTTSYAQYKIVLNNVGFAGGATKKLYGKFYIDGSLYGGVSQATYAFSSDRMDWHSTSAVGGQYNKHEMQLMNGGASAMWSGTITIPMRQNAATSNMSPYSLMEMQIWDYYSREGCKPGSANNTIITGLQLYNGTDSVNFGNYGRISVYRLKYS